MYLHLVFLCLNYLNKLIHYTMSFATNQKFVFNPFGPWQENVLKF